jgi:hypothetical protein
MPNEQISDFTAMGATVPAADDMLAVVDKSDTTDATTGTTKSWAWLDFLRELFATRFGADAGASDTYVVTLVPTPAAYVTGGHYRFKANTANTGACTVNFNSLGAKTIKKHHDQDLADGDIEAGQWVDVVYDGTFMQMQSQLGNAPSGGSGGFGDVVGPASATDNALARFDSTTGKLIQNSTVTLDDTGAITMPEMAAPSTPAANKVAVYAKSDGHLYIKDDAGTETDLAASGSGSVNPTSLFVPYNNAGTFDDSRIKREGTNVTALNGGVNTPQTFNIYKTDDGAGNSRFLTVFDNSGVWEMLASGAGSGGTQNLQFGVSGASTRLLLGTGALQPTVDRGYDLGGGSNRWNQAFLFTVIVNGGDITFTGGPKLVPTSVQLEVKDAAGSVYLGVKSKFYQSDPVTFANRPGTPSEGMLVAFTDSSTATWGATITGGGSNHVLGYYNGTNWTVAAI